jgi:uncharacterized protein YndB with AHSA1/START domain
MTGKTNVATDLESGELRINRTFDAPRDLVFKAWSECDRLKEWWGPRQWPLTHCEMDFRVGGTWLYCMTGPGGEEAWGKAVYSEIVPPERIVYTDYFADAQGNPSPNMPSAVLTLEFVDHGARTEIVTLAKYASGPDLQKVLDMGMIEGLSESSDRLDEYLATQTS